MTAKDTTKSAENPLITGMFQAGAHFGFTKSRRHSSFKNLIFGVKNKTEILDLEKTEDLLNKAIEFVTKLAQEKKTILFVASKNEAREILQKGALSIDMPYVASRWIGGTLTNFEQIKKRVQRLDDLTSKKERGELGKYTKKERLLFDREIEKLTSFFGGIRKMAKTPDALFVIDPKKEHIAVAEAKDRKIPVIALSGTDCDISKISFPIAANDSSRSSIEFFVNKITEAYKNAPAIIKA